MNIFPNIFLIKLKETKTSFTIVTSMCRTLCYQYGVNDAKKFCPFMALKTSLINLSQF